MSPSLASFYPTTLERIGTRAALAGVCGRTRLRGTPMNNFPGGTVTLSQLVRTEEQGLNVNRLLFAKFLVMTRRLKEDHPMRQIGRAHV